MTAAPRVNEIDLLRFLAALAVVFFHYAFRGFAADGLSVMPYPLLAPAAKYGYLGVQLFFMISGFVILMTAENATVRNFAISRCVRLYPAFWACCTLTFGFTLAMDDPRFSASWGQYLANMTMMSGFVGIPSIDGAYWSLFVEIRFYVLIILLMILGRLHRIDAVLVGWLVLSIALRIHPVGSLRELLICNYSPYFIAGATCFRIWSNGPTAPRLALLASAWALATFQSIRELKSFEQHYDTTMSAHVVAAIVTSFFLIMVLISLRRTGSFGRARWIGLGSLTYPLYLLHQYIGYMVFNSVYPTLNEHALLWLTVAGALLAAFAVHVAIERPVASRMRAALHRLADFVGRCRESIGMRWSRM